MKSIEAARLYARRNSCAADVRDLARKVFFVAVVFFFGFWAGADWFARYFATHLHASDLVRAEDQYALLKLQGDTEYWWVGLLLGIGILCFFLSFYRVTRRDRT